MSQPQQPQLKVKHSLAVHVQSFGLIEKCRTSIQSLPNYQALRGSTELVIATLKFVRDELQAAELRGDLTAKQSKTLDAKSIAVEVIADLFSLSPSERECIEGIADTVLAHGIVKKHAWRQIFRRVLAFLFGV